MCGVRAHHALSDQLGVISDVTHVTTKYSYQWRDDQGSHQQHVAVRRGDYM